MKNLARSALSIVVVGALLVAGARPATAQIVSTSDALALEEQGRARRAVETYLARQEVAEQLSALGVDPEIARVRAAALSADELEELAGRIHEAPAGAGVVEVIGITFIVLLILELLGVIDVFKKI